MIDEPRPRDGATVAAVAAGAADLDVLDAFDGEEETVRATLVALSQQVEREAMDDERHTVIDRLLVASAG